jgi:SAM-dependent methyltransferase
MTAVHGRETAGMVEAYDFSVFQSVADIGGGNGTTLCGILARNPKLTGTLFDLPGVIQRAAHTVEKTGLSNRIHLVRGDFFESVPSGADAYLLRHIIDERAVRILENVHRAMNEDGRLLVVESVIPHGNEPFFGKLLDVAMMVIPGGQERTEDQYRRLYAQAGFKLARIVPTTQEVSIIEGVPE